MFMSYSFQRGCGDFSLENPPRQFPSIKFLSGDSLPPSVPCVRNSPGGINRGGLTREEFDQGKLTGGILQGGDSPRTFLKA